MQTTLQKNLDTCNHATPNAGEIIVLGPTWRNYHPLTERLIEDLEYWGWTLTHDTAGRIYAMCHASHTEGTA